MLYEIADLTNILETSYFTDNTNQNGHFRKQKIQVPENSTNFQEWHHDDVNMNKLLTKKEREYFCLMQVFTT